MGTIQKILRAVSAGNAIITATDGTERNTVTTEVTVGYKIIPYLYTEMSPDFVVNPSDTAELITRGAYNYIEVTVKYAEQLITVDTSKVTLAAKYYYQSGNTSTSDIKFELQDGVTGPHGGPVYKVYNNSKWANVSDVGCISIIYDSLAYTENKTIQYTRTNAINDLVVNEGNPITIPFNINHAVGPTKSYKINVTYTKDVSDNMTPFASLCINGSIVDANKSGLYEITFLRQAGNSGTDTLRVYYYDGTSVVYQSIPVTIQEELSITINESSFNIVGGDTGTLTGSYTPAGITEAQLSNALRVTGSSGIQINDITIDDENNTFSINYTGITRDTNAFIKVYYLTPSNVEVDLTTINGHVTGAGYDLSYGSLSIPVGGSWNLDYTPYNSNNQVISAPSTITVSNSNVLSTTAVDSDTVKISVLSDGDGEYITLSVQDPITQEIVSTNVNIDIYEGIAGLTLDSSSYSCVVIESGRITDVSPEFEITPHGIDEHDVRRVDFIVTNNDTGDEIDAICDLYEYNEVTGHGEFMIRIDDDTITEPIDATMVFSYPGQGQYEVKATASLSIDVMPPRD